MRPVFLFLSLLVALTGCVSTPKRVAALSFAPVAQRVTAARQNVAAVKESVHVAVAKIATARKAAAAIARQTPQLATLNAQLSTALTGAQSDLADAQARSENAETALAESLQESQELQRQFTAQAEALNGVIAQRDDARRHADYAESRVSVWRRRAIGFFVVIVGSFVFIFRRPIFGLLGIPMF